jgi:hypothetical protein
MDSPAIKSGDVSHSLDAILNNDEANNSRVR